MNIHLLREPELEFGGGGKHIDVRAGIIHHGPFDRDSDTAPSEIRVGFVGTSRTLETLRSWLEIARAPIPARDTKQPNLFPYFPGFSQDSSFASSLVFHDRWTSLVNPREIDGLINAGESLASNAAEMFIANAAGIVDQGGPNVVIVAPPTELLAAMEEPMADRREPEEQDLDEASEPVARKAPGPAFHDLLKARGLELSVPIQMVRPETYGGDGIDTGKRTKTVRPLGQRLQDAPTRAWNMHTALYYKAGGIPWRLVRDASQLTTCFVGISFYRAVSGDRLLTSVAQVFNERGEGTIVKGGQAVIDRTDMQAHLSEADAYTLLRSAVQAYRREHRTQPARLVLHKTSAHSNGEVRGLSAAAESERLDTLDLVSVRRSFSRLFRTGTYPPLRGTLLEIQVNLGLVYLKGSVEFFQTYPGLYVPRPLEYRIETANSTVRGIGGELLALSKLNWNNTQFDGGEPITVRAARRVGDILKHVEREVQASFRFFM